MKRHELLEVRRQIFHIALGAAIISLLHYSIINLYSLLFLLVLGVLLSALSRKRSMPVIEWFLQRFERAANIRTFPGKGTIFFVAGCMLAVLLFPKSVALASIAVLTLGDSISHIVGRFLGKTRHPLSSSDKVMIEGSAAGTIAAFIGALMFVPAAEAFFGAMVAMIVEVIDIKVSGTTLDDNLLIPVVAGATMAVVAAI